MSSLKHLVILKKYSKTKASFRKLAFQCQDRIMTVNVARKNGFPLRMMSHVTSGSENFCCLLEYSYVLALDLNILECSSGTGGLKAKTTPITAGFLVWCIYIDFVVTIRCIPTLIFQTQGSSNSQPILIVQLYRDTLVNKLLWFYIWMT